MKIQSILAFAFGVIFVSIILLIALNPSTKEPTAFQYTVFRIILALAAGGIGAVIPGILNVEIPRFLTAGGALAVFATVYFYSPVQLMKNQTENPIIIPAPQVEPIATVTTNHANNIAKYQQELDELRPLMEDTESRLARWELDLLSDTNKLKLAEKDGKQEIAKGLRENIVLDQQAIERYKQQKQEQVARRDSLEKLLQH